MSNNDKFNFSEKLEKLRKNKYFSLILIIFLIAILVFVLFFSSDTESSKTTINKDDFTLLLENKLQHTLENIEGVGKVSVAITVDGGIQTVIAMKKTITESEKSKVIEEIPVMVNGKTVTLKEINPEIIGVVIVAEGAKSFTTIRKIQQATVSMLGVNIDKIEILTMK